MKEETKQRKWDPPEVRRYGTFQDATQQGCDKTIGPLDGLSVSGIGPVGCRIVSAS
jgi:hypothetical protein